MCLASSRQALWGVTMADAKALEASRLACQPLRAPRLQPSPNSQGGCQRSLINEREPLSKCRTPTWCSRSPLRASGPAGLRVSEAGGQPAEHLGDSREVPYSQSEPGGGGSEVYCRGGCSVWDSLWGTQRQPGLEGPVFADMDQGRWLDAERSD